MNWLRHHLAAVLAILAIAPIPLFAASSSYWGRILVLVMFFATLAVAVNIAFGHTDQLLLFSGGMAGLSSYLVIIVANSLGVSPWVTLLLGAVVAGVIGFVVVYVAARIELGLIAVSILTFAVQLTIIELFGGLDEITGGAGGKTFTGLSLQPLVSSLGVGENVTMYYTLLAIFALVLYFYRRLINSSFGLSLEMIRQDDAAAEATGVDVIRHKSITGFIATFIIGLVGPFYAQLQFFVLPNLFRFGAIDVTILIILVLGGLRTMYGPLVGAMIIIYLDEELAAAQEYRTAIYGLLLMVLFLYFRQGIVRAVENVLRDRLGLGHWIDATRRD